MEVMYDVMYAVMYAVMYDVMPKSGVTTVTLSHNVLILTFDSVACISGWFLFIQGFHVLIRGALLCFMLITTLCLGVDSWR